MSDIAEGTVKWFNDETKKFFNYVDKNYKADNETD